MAGSVRENGPLETSIQQLKVHRDRINDKLNAKSELKGNEAWDNLELLINCLDEYLRARKTKISLDYFDGLIQRIHTASSNLNTPTLPEHDTLKNYIDTVMQALRFDEVMIRQNITSDDETAEEREPFKDDQALLPRKPTSPPPSLTTFSRIKTGLATLLAIIAGVAAFLLGPPGWVIGLAVGVSFALGWIGGNEIEKRHYTSENRSEPKSPDGTKSSYNQMNSQGLKLSRDRAQPTSEAEVEQRDDSDKTHSQSPKPDSSHTPAKSLSRRQTKP